VEFVLNTLQDYVVFMVGKDEIAREWDEASESWADFVREGKDYFRDMMNGPAAFKLIGDVRGKHVLDLSCGEGSNARILAGKGAIVVGVDFSEKMIGLARKMEKQERLSIEYHVADATELKMFGNGRFDVVTCFMALMDIERFENAISEAARVLKKDGRFVFSVTHPCFETGAKAYGKPVAEWKYAEEKDAAEADKTAVLEVHDYFAETKCEVSWTMKRLAKPFKTTSFHRTLTDYFRALHRSDLLIVRLMEPKPTRMGIAKHAGLAKHTRIPHSLIVETVKK